MKKKYIYENAVVCIEIPDSKSSNIRASTEKFLRRVIKEKEERNQNGNFNSSRFIRKKSILDKQT